MVAIKFYGAAGTVTGSHFVVTTSSTKFAVDAGMFQGVECEEKNLDDYTYDVSGLDFVLLTHAHMDHSGLVPKLFKNGFKGKIYSTLDTFKLCEQLFIDSARIQENNFSKGIPYAKSSDEVGIVYNVEEAEKSLRYFNLVNFDETFSPSKGILVTYRIAGHILGAASIEIEVVDQGTRRKIVFSGDIGRLKSQIIDSFDKDYTSEADVIIMESLYGGITHPDREETSREFIKVLRQTVKSGGSVFIPSFAVQRTQELLHDLKTAILHRELDSNVSIFLDSPLAQRVTSIYENSTYVQVQDNFYFKQLRFVRKNKHSISLANKKGIVVIAGSGMADGGRIVSHLKRALIDKRNAILFVGFQAIGTLGRELVDGNKRVSIDGYEIDVKAQIHHFTGFSAHGDSNDYVNWLKRYGDNNKQIFLVHAEPDRLLDMKSLLSERGYKNVIIPNIEDEFFV